MDIPNTNIASSVASQATRATNAAKGTHSPSEATAKKQEPDMLELESTESIANEKHSNGEQFANRDEERKSHEETKNQDRQSRSLDSGADEGLDLVG